MTTTPFPDGFIWGTATAAHQVEGGNWNNDWWAWEHNPDSGCAEPSGDGCNHYALYEQDIAMLAGFGFNAYRFSVEWSRIEPENGAWSHAAVDHYRKVLEACHAHGVTPMVTYHHFTNPRWLAHLGGWEEPDTADRFASFCGRFTEAVGDLIPYGCTLNEPNIVALLGYVAGAFPPGRRDPALRRSVNDIFIDAHYKATKAIKAARSSIQVGQCIAMSDYQAVDGGESKRDHIREHMEDVFLRATEGDDFVGVQAYSRTRVGPTGALGPEEGVPTLIMGYEYYPECLAACIRRAWEVTGGEVPILVTENGIGTDDDAQRQAYVRTALEGVLDCIDEGIDVRGYTYWSLLDNFEWAYGYGPRFGLVDCDRTTFQRTPKPSARWYGRVAQANALVD